MSNQTVKQTWWPIVCAIFFLPFIVCFYVGKKCNDKKWLAIGSVFLVLFAALLSMYERFQNETWFQIVLVPTWICGFVLARYSWNTYRKEGAWWPLVCAIFSLPFIVFLYIGKKGKNKKWLIYGAIYLAVFIAIFVLISQKQEQIAMALQAPYFICGLIHSCYSWKAYLNKSQE